MRAGSQKMRCFGDRFVMCHELGRGREMTNEFDDDAKTQAAIKWFVTLQDCDEEDVWIAHRDWLESDPANSAAYGRVAASWIAVEDTGVRDLFAPDRAVRPGDVAGHVVDLAEARKVRAARSNRWIWVPFTAAAASVAAVLVWPSVMQPTVPPGIAYATDATHVREVTLADGSRITLDHDTSLVARVDGGTRAITLASGQAAFDVHHDAARPFTVTVTGRQVRVLGTAFGVTARNGAFGVSVSRGAVSVSAAGDPRRTVVLPAGKALSRLRGASQDAIADVAPANAIAWKTGELVYTSATLATLAQDYERMIGQSVVVDPSIRDLPIAGVLRAHDEAELVRQIALILPVEVVRTQAGRRIVPKSAD